MRETLSLSDSYFPYREKKMGKLSRVEYMRIVNGLFKFALEYVYEGHVIKMGEIGNLGINTKKINPRIVKFGNGSEGVRGIPPDWVATKKLWTEKAEAMGLTFKQYLEVTTKEDRVKDMVYCFNEHSNGLVYGFQWWKDHTELKNKDIYTLRLARANKRKLSTIAKGGDKEYAPSKKNL